MINNFIPQDIIQEELNDKINSEDVIQGIPTYYGVKDEDVDEEYTEYTLKDKEGNSVNFTNAINKGSWFYFVPYTENAYKPRIDVGDNLYVYFYWNTIDDNKEDLSVQFIPNRKYLAYRNDETSNSGIVYLIDPTRTHIEITTENIGAVSTTTTINNKPLNENINLTASDVGALSEDVEIPTAYTSVPIVASGSGSAGTSIYWSRGDHVHPAQTSVSGNAGTATTLQTGRSIQVNLESASAPVFDGSQAIEPGVTGILSAAHGGTGVTSLSALATAMGSCRIASNTYNGDDKSEAKLTYETIGFTPKILWISPKGNATGDPYYIILTPFIYGSNSYGWYRKLPSGDVSETYDIEIEWGTREGYPTTIFWTSNFSTTNNDAAAIYNVQGETYTWVALG